MRQVLTPDDLKKGDLAEPGWHNAIVDKYEEKDAEKDKSTNCYFYLKITDGPDKGVTPRAMFNEKALGYGKEFYAAIGLPMVNGGYELSSEVFRKFEGSKLQICIKRGKSDKGNEFNEIIGYRPLQ